ncbi:MAG: SdpI family protein [Firmicutes bacterium]|nr:SdpI family protein [Bacillota bacterium]
MQFFLCFVMPAFVLITGLRQLFLPPPEPTAWSGYRSTLAMKNIATWKAAQRVWGVAMLEAGIAGNLAGIACYKILEGSTAYLASMLISTLFASLTVPFTERKLSSTFDKEGKRKDSGGVSI